MVIEQDMIDMVFTLPKDILAALPLPLEYKHMVKDHVIMYRDKINYQSVFSSLTPADVLYVTIVYMLLMRYLFSFIWYLYANLTISAIKVNAFKFVAKWIPMVRNEINQEMEKLRQDCVDKFGGYRKPTGLRRLPQAGMVEQKILERIQAGADGAKKLYMNSSGNLAGGIYYQDDHHWNFISDVVRISIVSNPLHMNEFQYILQQEAELIRWTLNMYNGDENTCGIMTQGGTESILLAILSYREQAKAERGVTKPNLVMSITAHCAHDKACHFFGIEMRKVPIKADLTADIQAMRRQIDSNTICLVASAPEYGFGNYDPVIEIAALAKSYGIGCHCDCCLGSYINPFIKELGYETATQFDFKVPGVTTISCDPHKYGQGPKGCSILMFKEKRLREYQFFVCTDWTGGIYATTGIAGARNGANIAGNWAALAKLGMNGLRNQANDILQTQQKLCKAFANDKDIQVASCKPGPIFSFTSKTVNPIAMAELMAKKFDWTIHKVQNPSGAHICVTMNIVNHWEKFVDSIHKCAELMKTDPKLNTNADTALYGMTGTIPDKGLLHQFVSIHQAAMLDTLEAS